MRRAMFIFGLMMVISWSSYGQEVMAYGATSKWDTPWEQQLRWNKFLLKSQDAEKLKFPLGEAKIIERVDPSMPIAIPPQDEFSQFPVKVIPEDFPSDMPVAKLPDTVGSGQPTVRIVPRMQKEWPNP